MDGQTDIGMKGWTEGVREGWIYRGTNRGKFSTSFILEVTS